MKTALRSRLLDAEPVTDIVGAAGVDWGLRPQGRTYPWIGLKVVSDPRPQTYKGFVGMRQTRVQIDCLALDRATVEAMTLAVIPAIVEAGTYFGTTFQRAFIDSVQDVGAHSDTDGYVHRDKIDALIWHKGA